jgi:hypothetical protein
MSSMAALVFLGASAASSPSPATGITADQAMARYRAVLDGAMTGTNVAACPKDANSDIVVCGHDTRPPPRLPMPEARAEPGEVVHHLGEPPPAQAPSGPSMPSRQMQTVGKLFGLIRGAITGEDPDQP